MKIYVMGKDFKLNGKDVSTAKKMALEYFENIRKLSVQHIAPKLYWTSIVVMHVVTNELLNSIDPESLAMLLNGDDSLERHEIVERRNRIQSRIEKGKVPKSSKTRRDKNKRR